MQTISTCLWFEGQAADPAKSDKVMREVVKMTKLDIAVMQKAAA